MGLAHCEQRLGGAGLGSGNNPASAWHEVAGPSLSVPLKENSIIVHTELSSLEIIFQMISLKYILSCGVRSLWNRFIQV